MKRAFRFALSALFVFFAAVTAAHAQVPYVQGAVERVVLIHILPGHADAFAADLKANIMPIFEAQKAAGLIVDYRLFQNQTSSGPDGWDMGYSITYKNMAALDGLPDKVWDIRMKHFGDHAAETKVLDKRAENARLVSSMLIRDVTLR